MKNNSNYNKSLKLFARELRNDSTLGEVILWEKILKAKGTGYQFNRQYPLKIDGLEIIVDFICRQLKLIIEVDGFSHNYKQQEDINRDELLLKEGYTVLRVSEKSVRYEIDNAIIQIENAINSLVNM
ncbi:conserved hypothetical protein [uncultured Paludibacter sp.]|nr:conserved hypothetical protein [uncultured Paludibacter sp.]